MNSAKMPQTDELWNHGRIQGWSMPKKSSVQILDISEYSAPKAVKSVGIRVTMKSY